MPNYDDNINDDLLLKWLSGEVSDTEIKDTFGDENLTKYRQILSEIDQWQPSTDFNVFDPSLIINKKPEAKRRFLNARQVMSIAASLFLIVTIGYFYIGQADVKHISDFGETKEVLLPDGKSKVIIGPNSNVSWKKKDWAGASRLISLQGKAHFKVEPGDPFKVVTSNGFVEVLGTAFDVNQLNSSIDVKCYEGKVKATGKDGQDVILSAGQASLYHNDDWEPITSIGEKGPNWIQDEIKFNDAPISLVIEELISLYDIRVDFGNINLQRRFTGSFPTKNLKQSLEIVFGTLGITYQIEDKKLTLSE